VAEPGRPSAALAAAASIAAAAGVPAPASAVVSVVLGAPEVAVRAAAACLARGVRVGCFRPPSVPEGTSRLRLTARATLGQAELARVREVLDDVLDRTPA
jgi:8-amino-7-oxononanoate synthase